MSRTAYRTCPLCEATCGLEITLDGDTVTAVRGDRDDVFSHGFLCPKGVALKDLHEDPDRVRTPLVRRDGELVPASWDEAFAVIAERLGPILEAGGRDAAALYIGNPSAHNLSALLYVRVLAKALGTRNMLHGQHGRPAPQGDRLGAAVRPPADDRGARPRSHGPPADPRRQPAALQRQPAHGARHARPPARDPGARRQDRGDRPAAHAHGARRPTSTTSSARAPTRCCCSRWWQCSSRRGWCSPAGSPSSAPGSKRSRRSRPTSRPSAWPTRAASPPRRSGAWRASSPPRRARPSTGASGRRRRSSARSRPGWSTC